MSDQVRRRWCATTARKGSRNGHLAAALRHKRWRQAGGRPAGAGLQEQAPHHLQRQRSRAAGGSVQEKAGQRTCQVGTKQTNASEPLRTCRTRRDEVKTGASREPGSSLGETCIRPGRRPAGRRRELDSGACAARGNLSPRGQGSNASGGPMSVRVPRRGTGTESPVVARTVRSWGWSAGVTASGLIRGATRAGRNLGE
jgi:hypothetical protein